MSSKELEIYTDASTREFLNGRVFGCAGAIAPMFKAKSLQILPDSTNNRSEITAIYLAVVMAKQIKDNNPDIEKITIYSDSKISVFGLKKWMNTWIDNIQNGILYSNSGNPVANQDIFLNIISYLESNNLKINIRHQKGHVKVLDQKSMHNAKKVYYESNNEDIDNDKLSRICWYNNLIDEDTRNTLASIKISDYPAIANITMDLIPMCTYVPKQKFIMEHIC